MNYYDPDTLFGSVAVRLGLLDPNEARLCSQLKQQSGGQYSLEQILLQRGSISAQNAQIVRQHMAQYGSSPSRVTARFGQPGAMQNSMRRPTGGVQSGFNPPAPPPPSHQQGMFPNVPPAAPNPHSSYNPLATPSYPNPAAAPQAPAPVMPPMGVPGSGGQGNPSSSFGGASAPMTNGGSALIQVPTAGPMTPNPGTNPGTNGGQLFSSQSVNLPKIGDVFGRYKIESVLGKGGMGIVFKAVHEDLDRVVALKMLVSGAATSEKQLKRFNTEARSAARLSHPSIVPIHDVGEIDGLHYFTMDFVEGINLADRLKEKPMTEKEALTLMKELAEALDHAHARDVVHRDLKPANILIDENGVPKITDFGVAKDIRYGDGETMSGEVLGTPAYMSPEQADGSSKKIDGRSDIFSLGAILYEMLYKEQPFKGSTQYAVVTQVLTVDPEPPALERSHVSREAEAVCFKCLQKRKSKRYRTGQELADDLGRVLRGKKPLAPMDTRSTGGTNTSMLRPAFFAAVGGAVLLPLLIWGLWYSSLSSQYEELVRIGEDRLEEYKTHYDILKKALKQNRARARIYMRRAEQTAEEGEIGKALDNARKAIKLDPDTSTLRLTYARLLLEYQKKPDAALPIVEGLLDDKNVSKQAHKLKVRALWMRGDSLPTRKALGDLLKNHPETAKGIFTCKYQGLLAEQDGSWRVAIEEFRELLAQTPNDYEIRSRLARSLTEIKSWDQALSEADKSLQGDPDLYFALYAKALSCYQLKKYRPGYEAAKRARELEQDRGGKSLVVGVLADLKREVEKMRRKPPKRRPPPKRPMPPKRLPGVGQPTPKGQKERHNFGHALIKQASAMASGGNEEAARKVLDRVKRENLALCASAYNSVGVIYNQMRDYPTALQWFRSCLRYCAEKNEAPLPSYLGNAGWIYLQLKRYPESLIMVCRAWAQQAAAPPQKRNSRNDSYFSRIYGEAMRGAFGQATAAIRKGDKAALGALMTKLEKVSASMKKIRLSGKAAQSFELNMFILRGEQCLLQGSSLEDKKRALAHWKQAIKVNGAPIPQMEPKIRKLESEINGS